MQYFLIAEPGFRKEFLRRAMSYKCYRTSYARSLWAAMQLDEVY